MSEPTNCPRQSSGTTRLRSRSSGHLENTQSLLPTRRIRKDVSRSKALSILSDLDHSIIHLLSEHRVVTTQQIHLLIGVPERTLRYRLDRLWQLGLCGGKQPYVPKGSAPYHWYPSKLADSYARGAPLPIGGEKEDPSESHLAHAAAITGLYISLHRFGPSLGLETLRFARELEGREVFRSEPRESAIVPDASLVLRSGEAQYHALVEIDLGTMSMTRLAAKLGLYLAYAPTGSWHAEHAYLPPLLFMTTTPRRVDEIIRKFRMLVTREERHADSYGARDVLDGFVIGACAYARDAETALAEPVWVGRDGADELTFLDLVREPWERWHAADTATREAERRRLAYRERVLTDPETHRKEIQRRCTDPDVASPYRERYASDEYSSHLWDLEDNERTALEDLIDSAQEMTSFEREAYRFFLARTRIDDRGRASASFGSDGKRNIFAEERAAIVPLVEALLRRQRAVARALYGRHPTLPSVLGWIRELDAGELVPTLSWRNLQSSIDGDLVRLVELDKKAAAYRQWRETEARRRRSRLSALKQITHTFEKAMRDVDEELLRFCTTCATLAIPETDPRRGARWGYEWPRCAFCQRGDGLVTLADAERRGLIEYAGGFPKPCPVLVPRWVHARQPVTDYRHTPEEDRP
jgi:hypothetical protein